MARTSLADAKTPGAFSGFAKLALGFVGGAVISAIAGFASIVAFNELTAGDMSFALSGADVTMHGGA